MTSFRFHFPLALDSQSACEANEPAMLAIESALTHLQAQSALADLADVIANMDRVNEKPYISSFSFKMSFKELCLNGESEDEGPVFGPNEYRGFGFEPSWEEACAKSALDEWIRDLPEVVFDLFLNKEIMCGVEMTERESVGGLINRTLGEPAYLAWESQLPFIDLGAAGPGPASQSGAVELPCSIQSYEQALAINPELARAQLRARDLRLQKAAIELGSLMSAAPALRSFVLVEGQYDNTILARSNLRDDYPKYPYKSPPCPVDAEPSASADEIDRIHTSLVAWASALRVDARAQLLHGSIQRPSEEPLTPALIKQFLGSEGFAQWESDLLLGKPLNQPASSPRRSAPSL